VVAGPPPAGHGAIAEVPGLTRPEVVVHEGTDHVDAAPVVIEVFEGVELQLRVEIRPYVEGEALRVARPQPQLRPRRPMSAEVEEVHTIPRGAIQASRLARPREDDAPALVPELEGDGLRRLQDQGRRLGP